MAFFTTGVYYRGTFLKKETGTYENYYIGKSEHGNILVTVKGQMNKDISADVIYSAPYNTNKQYTVNFKDSSNWDLGIENIKDDGGKIVFEGEYREDSFFLYDKTGMPLMDDNRGVVVGYANPYKVSLKDTADFATSSNDSIRGNYAFLIIALLLFAFTAIGIKYPWFFFLLENHLNVKDPEPSEFHDTMQKLFWYINPIIIIALMLAGLTDAWPK